MCFSVGGLGNQFFLTSSSPQLGVITEQICCYFFFTSSSIFSFGACRFFSVFFCSLNNQFLAREYINFFTTQYTSTGVHKKIHRISLKCESIGELLFGVRLIFQSRRVFFFLPTDIFALSLCSLCFALERKEMKKITIFELFCVCCSRPGPETQQHIMLSKIQFFN
jgi:hypothetical protein